ncbi:unnamed protein product, partial [Iphiclides podalirius]
MKSFLDILLEMREADSTLTEEQIKHEVNTIVLAGQETAASALNFILIVLGSRPDVQGKLYSDGRSKHIWGPDALLFKPERWLDPSTASKYASTLLTFSTGKRVCIGRRYAINLIKTMLVHCLTEYEFLSEADKMTLQMDVLLRPTSGNLLRIRRRGRA